MPRKSTKSTPKTKYENNPFFVAGNGITLLYTLASGVFFVLLAVSLASVLGRGGPNDEEGIKKSWNETMHMFSTWTVDQWIMAIGAAIIIGLAVIMISALLDGVSSYTSLKISQGKRVKLGEAFREAFDKLWSYLWLQIIIFAKVLLWSLLFIIPGIVMAIRYSLAGVAFFDERKNLRGNAAVKESLRLTKGGWITTFASNTLFTVLTFGYLSSLVSTGVNSVLYRQFDELGNKKKPDAHWLSWLLFFVVLIFAILGIVGLIVFGMNPSLRDSISK